MIVPMKEQSHRSRKKATCVHVAEALAQRPKPRADEEEGERMTRAELVAIIPKTPMP